MSGLTCFLHLELRLRERKFKKVYLLVTFLSTNSFLQNKNLQ